MDEGWWCVKGYMRMHSCTLLCCTHHQPACWFCCCVVAAWLLLSSPRVTNNSKEMYLAMGPDIEDLMPSHDHLITHQ